MAKYKEYYYTTKKKKDGSYSWVIRNKEGEELQNSEGRELLTKSHAESDAREEIDEYYY